MSIKIDAFWVVVLDKVFGRMSGGCCGRVVSLQQINVGGRLIGIMGMNEVFQEYFKMEKKSLMTRPAMSL